MVGVGAGLGKHPPAGSNNGYSSIVFQPPSQGVLVIEMDFRGIKEMDFFYLLCFLAQVSVISSSGILSVTLVFSGWAGEGPDSGCPRGREGGEDLCFEIILFIYFFMPAASPRPPDTQSGQLCLTSAP